MKSYAVLIRYVLIAITIISALIGVNYLLFLNKLYPDHCESERFDYGKIFYNSQKTSSGQIDSLSSLIENYYESSLRFFEVPPKKLSVYYRKNERGISTTIHGFKKYYITFYDFNHQLPILHELIHVSLGPIKETWFSEGSATYLSTFIKYKDTDIEYHDDMNDKWCPVVNNVLCPIDDLMDKYLV